MCSGSQAGSYLRNIDFVYHSTLGVREIKKKKGYALDVLADEGLWSSAFAHQPSRVEESAIRRRGESEGENARERERRETTGYEALELVTCRRCYLD